MAFFDEIGKRITDGGQKAAEQARIFAEVNRLNGQVSEQERLISQLYTQIGKDYYEVHKENPEECVLSSVEGISALPTESVVETVETEAAPANICPGCGSKVEPGMKFCMTCGQKLD